MIVLTIILIAILTADGIALMKGKAYEEVL